MIFRHEYKGGVWVDVEQPTEEEIQKVASEFSIGDRIVKEVLAPTPSPLVARDGNVALLVLHFPVHGEEDGATKNQEMDFVVGKDFIVTVRYEVIVPLHHLKKLLEAQELVTGRAPIATDTLLEILFAHLHTSVRDHTNHIANHLESVERDMFDGRERTTVRLISSVSREFLHMESALANQEGPLTRFLKVLSQSEFFGSVFSDREERIVAEHAQIAQLIKTHRAITAELRQTNLALLETHQNEIMKTLTIITVLVLPLELIAVTLGIHAPGTPSVLESPNAFWIVIGIMFGTVVVMTIFFARKRWLS